MLILTRKIGETVVIGKHEVDITVLGIKGNQVRLGFIADDAISIHREEIYERIQKEKEDDEKAESEKAESYENMED